MALARGQNTAEPARKQFINYLAHIRSKHSLSFARYLAILEQQGHRCACCGTAWWGGKSNRPHVDHDHRTGTVRGLVCYRCNVVLGWLGDTYLRVRDKTRRFVTYLEAANVVG